MIRLMTGASVFLITNIQLYLVIGVPFIVNALLPGLVAANMRARFDEVHQHFDALDRRLDDVQSRWLAELHRGLIA
jgi:hypothetical protein